MVVALANARVLTPDEEFPRVTVILEEGRIAAVGEGLPPPAGAQIPASTPTSWPWMRVWRWR
jgi:dihydroorotase-like cyclic amidohydrolase